MSIQGIGIGVDRLILTGTHFNYGTGIFFHFFTESPGRGSVGFVFTEITGYFNGKSICTLS